MQEQSLDRLRMSHWIPREGITWLNLDEREAVVKTMVEFVQELPVGLEASLEELQRVADMMDDELHAEAGKFIGELRTFRPVADGYSAMDVVVNMEQVREVCERSANSFPAGDRGYLMRGVYQMVATWLDLYGQECLTRLQLDENAVTEEDLNKVWLIAAMNYMKADIVGRLSSPTLVVQVMVNLRRIKVDGRPLMSDLVAVIHGRHLKENWLVVDRTDKAQMMVVNQQLDQAEKIDQLESGRDGNLSLYQFGQAANKLPPKGVN